MKKQLAFVLSAVLCMGIFTGCGKKAPRKETSETEVPQKEMSEQNVSGKDVLNNEELWSLCTEEGEYIGWTYLFDNGKFYHVNESVSGTYKIIGNNIISMNFTEGSERFKKLSGEYRFKVIDEQTYQIYIETISEFTWYDTIASLALIDIFMSKEIELNRLSYESHALICSDKSQNIGTESLVWRDSGESAVDDLYAYIEEALAKYGDFEFAAYINGNFMSNLVIDDNPTDEFIGMYPDEGFIIAESNKNTEKIIYEGELTLNTACEFYKNYIQNGVS